MLARQHLPVVVFLFIFGVAICQFRLGGLQYAKNLVDRYGPSRAAKFHLLVPASRSHVQLCRALVSSALLGYPPVVLSGWNGTGELDAAVTHLAKIRNAMRYFDSLPPTADNDLVLIIDGFDVIMQLPPDVLIRRYFSITEHANAKLAARFGGEHTKDDFNYPHQSILFGADKLCWPVDFRRPACYAVPDSGISKDAFGSGDDIASNRPQWLNSGTIIGPISSMREMFAVTLERINATYDPEYICRESDQMYMSDVWGDQEYARSVRDLKMHAANNVSEQSLVPEGIYGYIPEGAYPQRWIPEISQGQKTEYQIGLDYNSSLFQAWAGYENFLDFLSFNGTNNTARVERNINDAADFKPYDIQMPTDVTSIARLLDTVSNEHNASVKNLKLGTNLVTHQIYSLFHCTGEKEYLEDLWRQMWFYPYAKSLLNATIKAIQQGVKISDVAIDGRIWTGAKTYPLIAKGDIKDDEIAYGAWADLTSEWLSWRELCVEYEDLLFKVE